MALLEVDKTIKEKTYLMAVANGIDLKYLYIPSIEIPDGYLESLEYYDAEEDEEETSLETIAKKSFDYHHYRTEVKQAHKIADRNARIEERNKDPFFWIGMYQKAQLQLITNLGQYYGTRGVGKIAKPETIKNCIELMDRALEQLKKCKINGEPVKIREFPTAIKVQRERIVEPTPEEKAVEDKYKAFCDKYHIDIRLIAPVRVFTNGGDEFILEDIDRVIAENIRHRKELSDAQTRYGVETHWNKGTPAWIANGIKKTLEDSLETFRWYSCFLGSRKKLRSLIGRYMSADMEGGLSEQQIDKLREQVAETEEWYRKMILSKHYKAGFALTSLQEIYVIKYNNPEAELEHTEAPTDTMDSSESSENKEPREINPTGSTTEPQAPVTGTIESKEPAADTPEPQVPATGTTVPNEEEDADAMLLDCYRQAKEIQERIENLKRKKAQELRKKIDDAKRANAEMASRIEEIDRISEGLLREKADLASRSSEMSTSIETWEKELSELESTGVKKG